MIAFYRHIGALPIEASPVEPTPAIDPQDALLLAIALYEPAETRECPRCRGCGVVQNEYLMRYDPCPRCAGSREIPIVHQV